MAARLVAQRWLSFCPMVVLMSSARRIQGRLLCLALSLPGCSFVLDFEELTRGDDDAPNQTPDGGSDKCGTCNDGDPCTVDTCQAGACVHKPMLCTSDDPCSQSVCRAGACVAEPRLGPVTLDSEHMVQVGTAISNSLVASADRVFASTLATFDDSAVDIVLSSFSADPDGVDKSTRIAEALADGYGVASPAALWVNDNLLHVYVAMSATDADSELGEVVDVSLDVNLELATTKATPLASEPSLLLTSYAHGPTVAALPNHARIVAWYGRGSAGETGLFVTANDAPIDLRSPGAHFIGEGAGLRALSALGTELAPGAAWIDDAGQVKVATTRSATELIPMCSLGPAPRNLRAIRVTDTLWALTWTTGKQSHPATETSFVFCDDDGCSLPADWKECSETTFPERVQSGIAELASTTLLAEAIPGPLQLSAIASEAGLGVALFDNQTGEAVGPARELVAAGDAALPHKLDVVLLPHREGAVSWIGAGSEADVLHLQKLALCLPDP